MIELETIEKETVMKIKAKISDSPWTGYEEGNVFEAEISVCGYVYIFIDNDGDERYRPIGEFEIVEEEKEEVMKVKAIDGCHPNLTSGKVYDVVSVSQSGEYWRVVDDNGHTDGYIPEQHFEVVEEGPKIEVGSVWIHDNGLEYEVTAVGETRALVKLDREEYMVSVEDFGTIFKAKPKTVTMYFYGDGENLYANKLKSDIVPILFTREIELP